MAVLRICCCVLLWSAASGQSFLLQLLAVSQVEDGRTAGPLCEKHALSLPVLPSLTDWYGFLDQVKAITTSTDYQPWIGLTHDGSNVTTPEHFTWADGQVSTYLVTTSHDLHHSNGTNPFKCVRRFYTRMRMTSCKWARHVLCQGSVDTLTPLSPTLYVKRTEQRDLQTSNQTQNISYFVTSVSPADFPQPLTLGILEDVVGVAPGQTPADNIDCFHICSLRASCHVVALLKDHSACFLQI
ncbi:uncharacterized protein LOC143276398 [Babylonia areolata]|uniref:uncharacterized protein LOC143276398 n=1 Tax=Babylonia areolata TaxID=304850 RepID=UPI003FD2A457